MKRRREDLPTMVERCVVEPLWIFECLLHCLLSSEEQYIVVHPRREEEIREMKQKNKRRKVEEGYHSQKMG
jgi:hypothetical protein